MKEIGKKPAGWSRVSEEECGRSKVRERTRGQIIWGLVHLGKGFQFALSEMESHWRVWSQK